MENEGVEQEYVAMKILATFLTEDSQRWFKALSNDHLETYEDFTKLFKRRWEIKKDSGMLMTKFNQI
jgi:hypothetical protein